MKFLITIVGLLVSAEIQFILGDNADDNTTINIDEFSQNQAKENTIELKPSSHNGPKGTSSQMIESLTEYKNQIPPDSLSSIQDMRKRAADKYSQIYKSAASALEKISTKVEKLKDEATTERDEAIRKCREQYSTGDSLVTIIRAVAHDKFVKAKESITSEYNQALAARNEKLKESAKAHRTAYEAAEIEFGKVLQKIEENKQKVENENQEVLEKAQKERDMALKAAKTNREKAKETYAKAMKSKTVMSSDEKKNLRDKLQEEIDKNEEAVEIAVDEWQKVLDTFGIGKEYEVALDNALKELEEARQKADLILEKIEDEEEKILEEVNKKKLQAESLANAEKVKAEDKCEEIQNRYDFQIEICSQKPIRQWRKILKPANEELRKANREFDEVKSNAENELKQTLEKADQMERKLTEVNESKNITTEKITGVKNQRSRRPQRKINK